ncbi:MAG: MBL fold metallo-hydrolase [Rhodobacterales bacterium]|nr:MAG: MBL fold metallo-hydrolase [Rhodobacterales bacterium]
MSLIRPSRRDMLKLAAAMPAMALAAPARAMLGAPEGENPGWFRFTLGEAKLTILSDGYFSIPGTRLGVNADPAEVKAFLSAHFLPEEAGYSHTNHLLIEIGAHKVLVDVGSGNRWFETTGRLLDNMEAAGVDPSGITHVVITHAHPDHIWGIRDDFDEPLFPDAEYIMGEAERAYWTQEGLVDRVTETEQQFVLGAVNSINVEGAEWRLGGDGLEVVPGVRIIDTPGHTPGHMSVVLESGGKQLIALGDCLTHAYGHFAHPEWYSALDTDGEQAVATRRRLLDMAATDRMAVLGYHFPFPGVGHVKREGDVFRFVPALWQFE